MTRSFSRRRFIAVTAAAGAAAFAPGAGRAAVPLHVWDGVALGARASLRLYHSDAAAATRLIETCRREIQRLERAFSLYRPDSALSRLNAQGQLEAPPLDLVRILYESRRLGALTGGAFDVTVQPLWLVHSRHFSEAGADPAGPTEADLAEALARVGQDGVEVASHRVAFTRPGMAATLNGVAQGYVTDRIAELLRTEGLDRVLVDLGETRAIGRADGRPWRAALADPRGGPPLAELDLKDCALATSAPTGYLFDAAGRFHHLFDPRTGRASARYASVSVLAPDATTADALSTAFAQMPRDDIAAVLARHEAIEAHLLHRDGRTETLRASS
jgi:FAD:protein FMN transferase